MLSKTHTNRRVATPDNFAVARNPEKPRRTPSCPDEPIPLWQLLLIDAIAVIVVVALGAWLSEAIR